MMTEPAVPNTAITGIAEFARGGAPAPPTTALPSVGNGVADTVPQPLAAGLLPAQTVGHVHLGPGRAATFTP
ncbi:hypothetical protein ACIQI7_19415 [Kitasatospora sp. NPDC092039]|uniref:hypothetical protein n=1 Tax=Kitasatospora sp. NPDC092039 TaxID=3364086 RepID=UPI0037F1BAC7